MVLQLSFEAYQHADDVKQFYKELRKNFEVDFHKVYSQAERMATAVNVDPSKPRSCARQRNRPNAQVETVEEWYRVNVAVAFLDHIIAELDSQFSVLAQTASKLLGLVPLVICSKRDLDLSDAVELYSEDFTSPKQFDQEFARWQQMYMRKDADKRSTSCAQALKECDSHLLTNIFVLLQIACTLPVTSCEYERNACCVICTISRGLQ